MKFWSETSVEIEKETDLTASEDFMRMIREDEITNTRTVKREAVNRSHRLHKSYPRRLV